MPEQQLFTPILRSRTLSRVAVMALIVGAYAGLAVWKENSALNEIGDFPPQIHSTLSLVLGLLLVFRTNAAYNRWWEARTLNPGVAYVAGAAFSEICSRCAAVRFLFPATRG